jgi:hypothetical protein
MTGIIQQYLHDTSVIISTIPKMSPVRNVKKSIFNGEGATLTVNSGVKVHSEAAQGGLDHIYRPLTTRDKDPVLNGNSVNLVSYGASIVSGCHRVHIKSFRCCIYNWRSCNAHRIDVPAGEIS